MILYKHGEVYMHEKYGRVLTLNEARFFGLEGETISFDVSKILLCGKWAFYKKSDSFVLFHFGNVHTIGVAAKLGIL